MRQKKRSFIPLLLVLCALIAAGGLFWAGWLQGSSAIGGDSTAGVLQVRGIARVQRAGLSLPLEPGSELRTGDLISLPGEGSVVLAVGQARLTLAAGGSLQISEAAVGSFAAAPQAGELFAAAWQPITLTAAPGELFLTDSVAALRPDSVQLLRGTARLPDGTALSAGQKAVRQGGSWAVSTLSPADLSDFALDEALRSLREKPAPEYQLCFAAEALELEHQRRVDEKRQQLEQEVNSGAAQSRPDSPADSSPSEASSAVSSEPLPESGSSLPPDSVSAPPDSTPDSRTDSSVSAPPPASSVSQPPVSSQPESLPPESEATPQPAGQCSFSIRCDTILDNFDSLKPEKAALVPESGVLLYPITVDFYEGETVLDAMLRVCGSAGLTLRRSGGYISSIGGLAERDCGPLSGWMYSVNGVFPGVGCGDYRLQPGDTVLWQYSCRDLGADLGAPVH